MKFFAYSIYTLIFLIIFTSCGGADEPYKVGTEPSDEIIRDNRGTDFSIVLNDMDVSERENKIMFQHKYHILKVIDDSLIVDSLDWKPVNKLFFEKHEKNLGMEIVSYHNGLLSKVPQPVGFGWAIGNEKYGQWAVDSTNVNNTRTTTSERRVWRSHTPSLLFWYWMLRRPAYQNHYSGYRNARGSGRAYYGNLRNGTTMYGTSSNYEKYRRPSFYNRRSKSTRWKSYNSSKTGRNSSRYNKGSSTRSRSGGIGK